ncbi:hypothetical protein Tco_0681014 [Tanacetum coccineum]|uniref:Uncharacterized protein n=1 Tax=Tanacetum coccineum TaxID=301880 RepID=A0ABQ4XMD9_9ASTR
MFIKYSTKFELELAKKRTASRRVVKNKVIIYANDNIIPDPNVALELGKSISITKAEEEGAARQVHATHSKPAASKLKLKGIPSLTPKEQLATDIMQALKESKKPNKRQPGTGGSSKGTGRITRVLDESIVISVTSSKGTGTKPAVPVEEKVSIEEKVILECTDDNKNIDLEMTDDEETNDEVLQDTDAAKADAEKIEEAKDDAKKSELPPTSSSLSVSSGFGDQFLKLSSDTSLIVPHIQSSSMLKVPVFVISDPPVLTPVQETPLEKHVTTLTPPFISTIPPAPLQQSTTPIPSPPIITDAPTITTAVIESNALSVVQQIVAKLEKDVSKLKKIDHSTNALATLKLQVPMVVEQYLGSNIGDDLQKVL